MQNGKIFFVYFEPHFVQFTDEFIAEYMIDMTMGVEQLHRFKPGCRNMVLQFSPLGLGITARIDDHALPRFIRKYISILLEGPEGEMVDLDHTKWACFSLKKTGCKHTAIKAK